MTYCSRTDCYYRDCLRHQCRAPEGKDISIADLDDGYCFIPGTIAGSSKREALLKAICAGIQHTDFRCANHIKALCEAIGDCTTCHTIADHVESLVKGYYYEIEAYWVDITKPGQVTPGGNPVYACGRCGTIYGSYELFPSAKYCKECGAKMKFNI